MLVPLKARRGLWASGTGVTESFEPGCWELNLDHPEGQQMLLNAEPSLQPLSRISVALLRLKEKCNRDACHRSKLCRESGTQEGFRMLCWGA